jgi:PAS domain S-box-containing protein
MSSLTPDLVKTQPSPSQPSHSLQACLLDHSYEPAIAWELDGTILYWNHAAEELYGFLIAQALGSNIHSLLKTLHPIPLNEILAQVEAQNLWSGELDYTTSEGVTRRIETVLSLINIPGRPPLILQNDRDNTAYKLAETAMRQVYEELEQRVEERTRDLASANKELESFSYSVSHDLRAPLRSLEGFTRILTLDYAGKVMDDRALDLMRRMIASVSRMGQLIEDLLKLSQVTRTVIHPQSLDLTAMATTILDDLRARDPDRTVDLEVDPGLTAVADPGLLRAVLENLLGNAWKFTGKTAAARIRVGVTSTSDSDYTYFIQDNGAGFDMEFADQLFAPFQRLHRANEFEGTGVGLATVQRVIHRHAGRIWAESSPGQGAKFFFTLGTVANSKRRATKA